jgi:hypothetical protein
MKYFIEFTRDQNNQITHRQILFAVDGLAANPRGKDGQFINGPSDVGDVHMKRVSLDNDGNMFIEDDPDKVALKAIEDEIALRMARQDFGRRVIAIITIRNDDKDLTSEQKTQISDNYETVNRELLNGRIDIAKASIQAATPDGTLITQADKDAILAEISANEARLGY